MWITVIIAACTDEPIGEAAVVLEPYLPDAERIVSVPVFGGTLETAAAVGGVVAADPEGDRLLRVVGDETADLDLGDNARPFRIHVEGTRAYVTLRGTGELASVALDTMTVEWRTRVCLEPRGVTRSPMGALVVACAGGELVEIDDEGNLLRLVVLDADLRDVVVAEDRLLVSRFATAEILEIDPTALVVTSTIVLVDHAGVAWRMRPHDDGALVLHQVTTSDAIDLTGEQEDSGEPAAYGSSGGGGYGDDDGLGCDGTIVDTVLTRIGGDGVFNAPLRDVTVGVDFVLTEDAHVAVANAGAREGGPGLLRFEWLDRRDGFIDCLPPDQERVLPTLGRAAALAIDVDGTLVVQSAAPFSLARAEEDGVLVGSPTDGATDAQRLFHADAGVGVACASCHPEGLDDGHVWQFFTRPTDVFLRRTMPLAGLILSRQPYHWDAAHKGPYSLMDDTFVLRMGGGTVEREATKALFDWLDGLRHVRAHPGTEESAIAIGRTAFATAECDACHAGAAFTTNEVESIGRPTESVKTPSLLGVGIRNELLHDGCVYDLDDRFRFGCDDSYLPTDSHGRVTSLTADEIEALKAYLRTL